MTDYILELDGVSKQFGDVTAIDGVSLKLDVIFGHLRHPIPRWLRAGLVQVNYGHYFNDRDPHLVYGDADMATLSFLFPL